jgi:hypothetical protein
MDSHARSWRSRLWSCGDPSQILRVSSRNLRSKYPGPSREFAPCQPSFDFAQASRDQKSHCDFPEKAQAQARGFCSLPFHAERSRSASAGWSWVPDKPCRFSGMTRGESLSTPLRTPSCRSHCPENKSIRHLRTRMYSAAHVTPAPTRRLPAAPRHGLAPHLGPDPAAPRSGEGRLWERRAISLECLAERPRLPHFH